MITIPLYIFLFLFLAVVAVCLILFGVIVYHLANGASLTFSSFVFTFFIFCFIAMVLYGTWYLLQDIGWSTEVFELTNPFSGGSGPTLFVE